MNDYVEWKAISNADIPVLIRMAAYGEIDLDDLKDIEVTNNFGQILTQRDKEDIVKNIWRLLE